MPTFAQIRATLVKVSVCVAVEQFRNFFGDKIRRTKLLERFDVSTLQIQQNLTQVCVNMFSGPAHAKQTIITKDIDLLHKRLPDGSRTARLNGLRRLSILCLAALICPKFVLTAASVLCPVHSA